MKKINNHTVTRFLAEGNANFHNKSYEQALDCYRSALKIMPEFRHIVNLNIKKTCNLLQNFSEIPNTLPSGKPWPKISVITPTYNQGQYIEETILSVIGQKYPNLEYIVIDGGSTDATLSILDKYSSHFSYIVSEADDGQSHALNKGFNKATGDILCWLNSDDQFAPNALFSVALAFDTYSSDMVIGICEIYEDGILKNRHMTSCADGILPLNDLLDLKNGWNAGQFFYQPEVFFTHALWLKSGGYVREDYYYSMDYELWCRFAHSKANIHVIGKPLALFRTHADQKTAATSKFKKELEYVQSSFKEEHNISVNTVRPNFEVGKTLKVLFLNDNGFNYGAGIAHQRMFAAFQMVGHFLVALKIPSHLNENYSKEKECLLLDIQKFSPDLIIAGNFHAGSSSDLSLIQSLLNLNIPTYWITHDFWLFTGRCAYTSGCTQYLKGCTSECPSFNEYPIAPASLIPNLWSTKDKILQTQKSLSILGNSKWSKEFVDNIKKERNLTALPVSKITLGVPTAIYTATDKETARKVLGINPTDFVLIFSVSSLSEKRKGAHFLVNALNKFNQPNVTLLLLGNSDVSFSMHGKTIIKTGYVTNNEFIVNALSASDVYIGPSTEETLGQVFLEAACVGVPSIGFEGSGVEDAIVNNITGYCVPPSVANLLAKIEDLYFDRNLLEKISFFAKIHALNEFSLYSSYHSFFQVLREDKNIDKFKLPHKIGFDRLSQYAQPPSNTFSWTARTGMSNVEGPYPPQYAIPFSWCYSAQTEISFSSPQANCLIIEAINPIFSSLTVSVSVDNILVGKLIFDNIYSENVSKFEFDISLTKGWHTLVFSPEKTQTTTQTEQRPLSFALVSLDVL